MVNTDKNVFNETSCRSSCSCCLSNGWVSHSLWIQITVWAPHPSVHFPSAFRESYRCYHLTLLVKCLIGDVPFRSQENKWWVSVSNIVINESFFSLFPFLFPVFCAKRTSNFFSYIYMCSKRAFQVTIVLLLSVNRYVFIDKHDKMFRSIALELKCVSFPQLSGIADWYAQKVSWSTSFAFNFSILLFRF